MAVQRTLRRERDLSGAVEFIRRSFYRRPTLAEIADRVGLSSFHFQRTFKRQFGESPLQMVTRLQIDLAKKLLLRGVPLREVARRCGFSHQSHFTYRFRVATGSTPGRWVRRISGGAS